MKKDIFSTEIDVQKCVENVGGNQFQMILVAAARAREIASRRNIAVRNNPNERFKTKIITEALDDVEQGRAGIEYLDKLHAVK